MLVISKYFSIRFKSTRCYNHNICYFRKALLPNWFSSSIVKFNSAQDNWKNQNINTCVLVEQPGNNRINLYEILIINVML